VSEESAFEEDDYEE